MATEADLPYATDPRSLLLPRLQAGAALCLLPLGRALVEETVELAEDLWLMPGDAVRIDDLRIVSWPAFEWSEMMRRARGRVAQAESAALVWAQSGASGVTREAFFSRAILAFPVDLDWDRFLAPARHQDHLDAITSAQAKAEAVFDLVRFRYCNPRVTGTLPGRAGYLSEPGFSAALFYSLADHESYIVAGETITHDIVAGIGLDFDGIGRLEPIYDGETGHIVRHALRLHTAALEASTETLRFVQYMSLLEYLAAPAAFLGMADVKKPIGRHVARTRIEYDEIMEDFRQLTSLTVDGGNIGYRHNIVHLGRRFEDLADREQRSAVFERLSHYAGAVIHDLIRLSAEDWSAVEDLRTTFGKELGLER